MNQDDDITPFELPTDSRHPATIAARLLQLPEHIALKEADVSFGWLVRGVPKEKGGKVELGSVHAVKTMFQGQFKDLGLQLLERMLGYLPTFLVIVDGEFWRKASDMEREALVWHEISHVRQAEDAFGGLKFDKDGNPVFRIVGHDVEAFNSEVVRYGPWHEGIKSFLHAART